VGAGALVLTHALVVAVADVTGLARARFFAFRLDVADEILCQVGASHFAFRCVTLGPYLIHFAGGVSRYNGTVPFEAQAFASGVHTPFGFGYCVSLFVVFSVVVAFAVVFLHADAGLVLGLAVRTRAALCADGLAVHFTPDPDRAAGRCAIVHARFQHFACITFDFALRHPVSPTIHGVALGSTCVSIIPKVPTIALCLICVSRLLFAVAHIDHTIVVVSFECYSAVTFFEDFALELAADELSPLLDFKWAAGERVWRRAVGEDAPLVAEVLGVRLDVAFGRQEVVLLRPVEGSA